MNTDCSCSVFGVCFECRQRTNRLRVLEEERRILQAEADVASMRRRHDDSSLDNLFYDIFGTRRVVVERPVVIPSLSDRFDVLLGVATGVAVTEGVRAIGRAVAGSGATGTKKSKKLKEKK